MFHRIYSSSKHRQKQMFCLILMGLTLTLCTSCGTPASSDDRSSSETHLSSDASLPSDDASLFPPEVDGKIDLSGIVSAETSMLYQNFKYDYAAPMPASDEVGNDYFSDAVFIGNSRTQGFVLYSGLENVTAYTSKGLMVDTAFTKKEVSVGSSKMTAMNALTQNSSFSKVYVMFGINELGWASTDIFIEKYGALIDKIKEINPAAKIYVQSILPVSAKKSGNNKIYTMTNINRFNALIQKMTADKEVYYLNVLEGVIGKDGYLPAEASTDGVHLRKEYCKKWLAYLKTHTAEGLLPKRDSASTTE